MYTEDYGRLKYLPSRLISDNTSDNLRLEKISTSCCRETPLVFTGMLICCLAGIPGLVPERTLVSPAAHGTTKALSELITAGGSERINRNYSLHRRSTPLPLAELPGKELEHEPGKSKRHSSRLHTAQSHNTCRNILRRVPSGRTFPSGFRSYGSIARLRV